MIEKLNVPDGWQDVTIGQFQELSNIDLEHKDAVLNAISILITFDNLCVFFVNTYFGL